MCCVLFVTPTQYFSCALSFKRRKEPSDSCRLRMLSVQISVPLVLVYLTEQRHGQCDMIECQRFHMCYVSESICCLLGCFFLPAV